MAVADKKAAWSTDQAGTSKVEWLSFISGPSMEFLKADLDKATAESFIPYAPTMSQYVTAEEAAARYKNLADFYTARGHFVVQAGPYYVFKASPVEKSLTLNRWTEYPDIANKWDVYGAPKLATVAIDGPGQVAANSEAKFDVTVTDPSGAPYPANEVSEAKYMVFDGQGNMVASGEATAAGDGAYTVDLTADATKAFTSGSYKLEVAVSPTVVSIPAFASYEFVVP
jgi:peptide/nickel transport system substrate-binding protein